MSQDGDPIYPNNPSYNVNDELSVITPDINETCVDFDFPDKCLTKRPDEGTDDVGDGNWEDLNADHAYMRVSVRP